MPDQPLNIPQGRTKEDMLRNFRLNIDDSYVSKLDLKRRLKNSRKHFYKFTDFMLRQLEKKIKTRWDFINLTCLFNRRLQEISEKDFLTFILLRGSLWHIDSFIYINSHLLIDDKDSEEFILQALDTYKEFIHKARQIFSKIYALKREDLIKGIPHNEDTYYFVD